MEAAPSRVQFTEETVEVGVHEPRKHRHPPRVILLLQHPLPLRPLLQLLLPLLPGTRGPPALRGRGDSHTLSLDEAQRPQ